MAKRQISPAGKEIIKERAGGCCEYCQFPSSFSHDSFHTDHILPPIKGGTDALDNLAFACDRCNSKKWTRTDWTDSETGVNTPIFHPREDKWQEHFTWNQDFSQIIGLTAKRRATIDLLEMNRPGLVNVRKALRAWGVHPPNLTQE